MNGVPTQRAIDAQEVRLDRAVRDLRAGVARTGAAVRQVALRPATIGVVAAGLGFAVWWFVRRRPAKAEPLPGATNAAPLPATGTFFRSLVAQYGMPVFAFLLQQVVTRAAAPRPSRAAGA